MQRTGAFAIAVLMIFTLGMVPAAAGQAGVPSGVPWRADKVPAPPGGTGDLDSVSCTSADFCMAVGTTSAKLQAFAEEWNGTKWSVSPIINPGGKLVDDASGGAVSCVPDAKAPAKNFCEFAGDDFTAGAFRRTLAETFDGNWSVQSSPDPSVTRPGGGGPGDNSFFGVSCASATHCEALVEYAVSSGQAATIATMSGATWRVDSGAIPASALGTIACSPSGFCMVLDEAGQDYTRTGSSGSWHAAANPIGALTAAPALSCPSGSSCVALADPASGPTLASYSGGTWQSADVPPDAGATHGTTLALSCLSPEDCTLLEGTAAPAIVATLARSGGSWHVISRDNPPPDPARYGVISCVEGLCMTVGLSEPGGAGHAVTAHARFSYVALGDSYSAGEGDLDYYPGTADDADHCHRSANAYGVLLAKRLGFSSFSGEVGANHPFGACSGAIAADLTKNNHDNKGEPPQESHLTDASAGPPNPDVDLVTLNLGGNDMGFGALVTDCVAHGIFAELRSLMGIDALKKSLRLIHFDRQGTIFVHNSCQQSFTEGLVNPLGDHESAHFPKVDETLKLTIARLHSAYLRILSDVPGARVLVVGYPNFFPAKLEGAYCDEAVTKKDTEWASAQIARFDAAIKQAVEEIGNPSLTYVAPTGTSGGWAEHSICAKDPWFIQPLPLRALAVQLADHKVHAIVSFFKKFDEPYWSDRLYFHPTPEGQRQLLLSVREALGQ